MADDNMSLDEFFAKAKEVAGIDVSKLTDYVEKLKAGGVNSLSFAAGLEAVKGAASAVVDGLAAIARALGVDELKGKAALDSISGFLREGQAGGATTAASLMSVGLALEPLLGILPKGIRSFGELGEAGINSATQISDSFTALTPLMTKFLGVLGKDNAAGMMAFGEQLVKSADLSRNLESNLIGLAAAAGDLGSITDASTGNLMDLTTATSTFATFTYETAQATGTSVSAVASYAQQLGKIPGALRENVDTGSVAVGSMNMLAASMAVATSFGMKYSDMVSQLDSVYRKFNLTGTDAISIVAQMASTAQELKLPMDLVSQTITDMSGKFLMFGDNTQSAVRIVQSFGKAFKESGLSPEGITKLMSSMTAGMAQMDLGTKAFVSGSTGGRGGLAGAFEMDLAMKRGDMGSVMSKAMEAMRKEIGGKIVTLEETVQTPALAGQMMKQIAFLRDVLHMAGSNEEAYRILDAMKKGAPGEIAKAKPEDATVALRTATERGVSIQERHTDILKQSANYLAHLTNLQAIQTDIMRRKFLGKEGEGDVAESIRRSMEASRKAGTSGLGGGGPGSGLLTFGGAMERATESGGKGLTDFAASAFSGIMDKAAGGRIAEKFGPAMGIETITEGIAAPGTAANVMRPATRAEVAAGEAGRPGRAGTPGAPGQTPKEITVTVVLEPKGELVNFIKAHTNKNKDAAMSTIMSYPGVDLGY